MNLDEAQKAKVSAWIEQGLKLAEIQSRMLSELGLRLTYMDVRFLVDDLKLVPKDIERQKAPAGSIGDSASATVPAAAAAEKLSALDAGKAEDATVPAAGGVSVSVDQLARPGTVVSGKVTFTDGNKADWYIDQTGRLGLAPQVAGYRPPAAEVQQFQTVLEAELSRMGL
jgi:hypothetical protein